MADRFEFSEALRDNGSDPPRNLVKSRSRLGTTIRRFPEFSTLVSDNSDSEQGLPALGVKTSEPPRIRVK